MTQVLEQKAKDKAGSQELDTEKYPLQQTYDYDFSFGTCEITCALNEEKNEFYIGFYAFDMDQVVTGTVNEDGIITVEYDASGFFGGEAQSIFSAADPDAWNK